MIRSLKRLHILKRSEKMSFDLKYWIALSNIPDLGPSRIKLLLEHFKNISNIRGATFNDLIEVEGIGPFTARSIIKDRDNTSPLNDISLPADIRAVTLDDPGYPKNLYNIWDPPPVLYYKGILTEQDNISVAVVGSRCISPYGEKMAWKIAEGLVDAGITVVSGLALGIDSCAHSAALKRKGRTLAVLGTGLHPVYPQRNKVLAQSIMDSGALICEYPEVKGVEKWNFPKRNRIISGLSLGVVVVEGAYDSGSLITARFALEQNREVFAVPGDCEKSLSRGPNQLIKQGAKLVEDVDDILDELNLKIKKNSARKVQKIDLLDFPPDQRNILSALTGEPKHLDRIAIETSVPVGEISSILVPMIVKGLVAELPGKYYSLR